MHLTKTQIRARFRKNVFERDGYTCVTCGTEGDADELDAHHITDRNEIPHGGYVKENGITLCATCHIKAEVYHQSEGMDWPQGFHPHSLYWKIESSPQKAVVASEKKLS